jgi:hypothetical protein
MKYWRTFKPSLKFLFPMPVYKNRPEMSPDEQLCHYSTLEAVVAMISGPKLRLTRLDAFDDPFEGSVPKQTMDDQIPLFAGHQAAAMMKQAVSAHYPSHYNMPIKQYFDLWGATTLRRKAMTRSAHAICWRAGEESEAMWRLYCNDGARGQGLALRTSLQKLEQSVSHHDVFVSPVVYRHYHIGPAFTDGLDAFMHKRNGFKHESEVRLLKFDQPHYFEHAAFIMGHRKVEPAALPEYVYLDWTPFDAVDAIVISPYASQAYEDEARRAIHALSASPPLTVELSELSERRYGPNF